MQFAVYIEVGEDGSAMAHVPALPGCVTTGLNQDVALGRMPQAITDYYKWLKLHGEQVPDHIDPIDLEVAGVSTEQGPPGDATSFFPTDRGPMTEQEVATLLRLMSYSRQDLIQQVSGMSAEILNWKPSVDDGQESWDIADILDHLAAAERFFISRLNTDIIAMLQDSRNAAIARLSSLSDGEMSRVTEHEGELWSARKIFRRILEHEHEHQRHVEQVLERVRAAQGLR